ncbi:MAG: efflux RND transporter periplasmic adaptor subunit [Desulfomonile tiedjei]|nr:efflux RND transporter periplasmic adaptor subunit [Desulfomonile tiedjei]
MNTPKQELAEEALDYRRKALAIGVELAKNAARARTLDELQFILVNDTRSLLPFDRALLIVHFEGKSALLATNNQPRIERKSDFVQRINEIAPALKGIREGMVMLAGTPVKGDLSPDLAAQLEDYMSYSKSSCVMVLPLLKYDDVVGHLVLEFFRDASPGEVEAFTLMNMLPFLASALTEKWMLAKDPKVRRAFFKTISAAGAEEAASRLSLKKKLALVAAVLLLLAMFVPVTLTVGGRADVAPDYEYFAYVQMDGIVDKVSAKEGDSVKKDQPLAELEAKEIDYKIREAKRLLESYKTEMEILRNLGAENPMKLAESQLVAIKSLRAKQELDFLNWQRQFLTIRAPVDGVILTKKAESLLGKKFKAGEPFCKIAPHDVMVAEVFVRESDISFVAVNQPGEVYFNFQPDRAHKFRVVSISPISETLERAGSVFRVRANFLGQLSDIKPGMQGIAHIDTDRVSMWFMLTRRIRARLNEVFLYF